jgi:hypothetical protein
MEDFTAKVILGGVEVLQTSGTIDFRPEDQVGRGSLYGQFEIPTPSPINAGDTCILDFGDKPPEVWMPNKQSKELIPRRIEVIIHGQDNEYVHFVGSGK